MRYNLSERDGKKLAGGITIFGGVAPAVIYNNMIYYEPDRLAGSVMFNGEGGAVTSSIFGKSGRPDARFYNNILVTNGRGNPAAVANNVWSDGSGTFTFDNNVWWSVDGGVRFQWGGSAITSWSDWQANGFDAHSLNADPRVLGPLGGGPGAYSLVAGSPAIDRGQTVTDALRGMGTQDAFGAATPQGARYDIGAFEYRVIIPDPAAPRILRASRQMDGGWHVAFAGLSGRSYLMESSADLRSWATAGQAIELSPAAYEFIDRNGGALRYYRGVARGLRAL